ncbi:insulin-induced protein-domain-containing protein [Coniella lustricola]|uniref:Insulin-induced protein-domain-containing protein n=1 Tax=Coniella lustricola TaxID=2025994 RepID=A0A2T3AMZ4_9PEZI|nr:insulin-induced protein-domain-containing protein [Coniella lustricola]
MSDSSPEIRRPIPRRPFEIGALTASSAYEDSPPASPPPFRYDQTQNAGNHLDPNAFNPPLNSQSRAASYKALTSSTLSGIYSPAISGYPSEGTGDDDGSATPIPHISDASIYKLVRERSQLERRRSSGVSGRSGQGVGPVSPLYLGLRTGLLFLLGIGYGALLSRLSSEQQRWKTFSVENIISPGYDAKFLAAWGVCGVLLGSLLPWIDEKWENVVEENGNEEFEEAIQDDDTAGTDWALVVRGIGAFAGIVFALRKVPWASTMQVSLTLAMVNPLLWYLIDRSKPGFVLSAATGLVGSVVLMGVNPEIMPAPASLSSGSLAHNNGTGHADGGGETLVLGGLATQKTIETSIWVLSVLFCSCVCFGNIGRRLALNKSAVSRGRWAGLR